MQSERFPICRYLHSMDFSGLVIYAVPILPQTHASVHWNYLHTMARSSATSKAYLGFCTCMKCWQHNPNGRPHCYKTAQRHAKQELQDLQIAVAASNSGSGTTSIPSKSLHTSATFQTHTQSLALNSGAGTVEDFEEVDRDMGLLHDLDVEADLDRNTVEIVSQIDSHLARYLLGIET